MERSILKDRTEVVHTFQPVYDGHSKILILGTMPSIKSRAENFYYMHPLNLFWRVLSVILETEFPVTVEDKKTMLLANRIALWDVLKSCDIQGSSDSSIRNPVPNDFSAIIRKSNIKAVFTNGSKAEALYNRYCRRSLGIDSIRLPSTSPANRKYYDFSRICSAWSVILSYIK